MPSITENFCSPFNSGIGRIDCIRQGSQMDFEVAGVYDKIARNCGKIWKNSRKFWEI
jgi:hypothetical protein